MGGLLDFIQDPMVRLIAMGVLGLAFVAEKLTPSGSVANVIASAVEGILTGKLMVSLGTEAKQAQALKSSSSALTVARPAPMPVVAQAVPSGPTVAQQAPPDDIFQGGGG